MAGCSPWCLRRGRGCRGKEENPEVCGGKRISGTENVPVFPGQWRFLEQPTHGAVRETVCETGLKSDSPEVSREHFCFLGFGPGLFRWLEMDCRHCRVDVSFRGAPNCFSVRCVCPSRTRCERAFGAYVRRGGPPVPSSSPSVRFVFCGGVTPGGQVFVYGLRCLLSRARPFGVSGTLGLPGASSRGTADDSADSFWWGFDRVHNLTENCP